VWAWYRLPEKLFLARHSTSTELRLVELDISPGMVVRFRFDGVEHSGIVNRISKRATVLVENCEGKRYSDGKHYIKFYVLLQLLEAVECASAEPIGNVRKITSVFQP
jgi:hypothetical protein